MKTNTKLEEKWFNNKKLRWCVPFSACCSSDRRAGPSACPVQLVCRISLHCAPLHAPSNRSAVFHFFASLTDMHASLHAPSDRSAVFHFVAPLTDMRIPLHAPSDWSAVFHFVAPLTDMRAPLHNPSDWSAVFHFVDPLTDMRAPLHAPSGPTAIFHFVTPLIGIYAIHVFLLLTYAFSLSHKT
jgi:hypothetical protein